MVTKKNNRRQNFQTWLQFLGNFFYQENILWVGLVAFESNRTFFDAARRSEVLNAGN